MQIGCFSSREQDEKAANVGDAMLEARLGNSWYGHRFLVTGHPPLDPLRRLEMVDRTVALDKI